MDIYLPIAEVSLDIFVLLGLLVFKRYERSRAIRIAADAPIVT